MQTLSAACMTLQSQATAWGRMRARRMATSPLSCQLYGAGASAGKVIALTLQQLGLRAIGRAKPCRDDAQHKTLALASPWRAILQRLVVPAVHCHHWLMLTGLHLMLPEEKNAAYFTRWAGRAAFRKNPQPATQACTANAAHGDVNAGYLHPNAWQNCIAALRLNILLCNNLRAAAETQETRSQVQSAAQPAQALPLPVRDRSTALDVPADRAALHTCQLLPPRRPPARLPSHTTPHTRPAASQRPP